MIDPLMLNPTNTVAGVRYAAKVGPNDKTDKQVDKTDLKLVLCPKKQLTPYRKTCRGDRQQGCPRISKAT